MTKARLDGLYLLMLGSMVFLLLGTVLAMASPLAMVDFRGYYYPARCLAQQCDPYNNGDVLRIAQAEGGNHPGDTANSRQDVTQYVYPPSAFLVTLPFAMLPWMPAHILWMMLTIASLIFASFLIWDIGADYAPILSGVLVGFLLANSEVLVIVGNMAGITISLCVIAAWCFFRNRFVLPGIVCFAVSLALKPQDVAMVWLCLFLMGGVFRKRALQVLFVTLALSLPLVLWVWHISPHWIQEEHTNILAFAAHGGTNDPGPASTGAHGLGMVISLQSVFSYFWDNPRFYNPASYLAFAPFFLIWSFAAIRRHFTSKNAWIVLAAIAALSLLPIYHRQTDAKLLLLTVPACAILWAEGGKIGRLALAATTAGFIVTGDIPWMIFAWLARSPLLSSTRLSAEFMTGILALLVPLTLLSMGSFYLWVCLWGRSATPPAPAT